MSTSKDNSALQTNTLIAKEQDNIVEDSLFMAEESDNDFIAFTDGISSLAEKVQAYKSVITSEQHTKNAFIEPLMKLLGYDTSNPIEVIPEYTSDFATKKGEKVDYAILLNNTPVMLIEAKDCRINLSCNEIGQLYRYFSVSSAKLALLTNGIDYWFFTDNSEPNKMDRTPFFKFNVLEYTDLDVRKLYFFSKNKIDVESIKNTISSDKFKEALLGYLGSQTLSVSNEFVAFIQKVIGFHGLAPQSASVEIQNILRECININTDIHKPVSSNELDSNAFLDDIDTDDIYTVTGMTGCFYLEDCNTNDIFGSRPISISIGSYDYPIATWYSLFTVFIKYYKNVLGGTENDLLEYRLKGKPIFDKIPQEYMRNAVMYESLYFCGSINAKQAVGRLIQIFNDFNIPIDSVKITMEGRTKIKKDKNKKKDKKKNKEQE